MIHSLVGEPAELRTPRYVAAEEKPQRSGQGRSSQGQSRSGQGRPGQGRSGQGAPKATRSTGGRPGGTAGSRAGKPAGRPARSR
jgi:hypothetical protein